MSDQSFLDWPFFEDRHRVLAAGLEDWAKAHLPVDHGDVDAACRGLVAALGKGGWLLHSGAAAGEKLDVRSLCLIRETLARHDGLADFAFAMQGLGMGAVSLFGTEAQRAWLGRTRAGQAISAFALTEPGAGSDVAATATTAPRGPQGWVLNGEKTWIVEAALMARRIAPGIGRRFAFEKLLSYDHQTWTDLLVELQAAEIPARPGLIHAADHSAQAVTSNKANLALAGLTETVTLQQGEVLQLPAPAEAGLLVTNPPYGHRMGEVEALQSFYPQFGDHLKKHFCGWTVQIFTADMKLPGLLRLAPSRRVPLFNGAIECRLFEFRMVAGSLRKPPPHASSPPPR